MRSFRTWVRRLFGIVLVLAGLPPVLYCLALVGWQFINFLHLGIWGPLPASLLLADHPFRFLPHLASGWLMNLEEMWRPAHQAVTWMLPRLHAGVLFAAPGMVVMAIGTFIAMRRAAVVRRPEKLHHDRPRDTRVHQSREHAARVEPFIGDIPVARDKKAA